MALYICYQLFGIYNYCYIFSLNHLDFHKVIHLLAPPLREPHADAVWSVTDGEELRNRL